MIHPQAQKFAIAQATAGYTMRGKDILALHRLCVHLNGCRDGSTTYVDIYSTFNVLYPVIGTTATSHAMNLVSPGTNLSAPNYYISYTGTITHNDGSMVSNGTTGKCNCAMLENVNTATSRHLAVYSKTDVANTTNDIGTTGSPFDTIVIKYTNSGAKTRFGSNVATQQEVSFPNANTIGLYEVSQTAASAMNVYGVGTAYAGNPFTKTDGSPNTQNYEFMHGPTGFSTREHSYYSLGSGHTASQASSLNSTIVDFVNNK